MNILADRAIPYLEETIGTLGRLETLPAAEITPSSLADTDALVVRTRNKITSQLLHNSKVRFVATVAAGTDHVDIPYLQSRGIEFVSSPGCNANAVAEYVVTVLMVLSSMKQFTLANKTLGVVGVGNVGGRLVDKARILGMKVLENDPPRQQRSGEAGFVPLEETLRADIVTLHVPLTKGGNHPTYQMIGQREFQRMRPGTVLINTSRGPVIDTVALKQAMSQGRLSCLVLDVWEGEPEIDLEVLDRAVLGTPHIAGYTTEGRLNAVRNVYSRLCEFLGQPPRMHLFESLLPGSGAAFSVPQGYCTLQDALASVILQFYPIEEDDKRLRAIRPLPSQERAQYFERLRSSYEFRREFASARVHLPPSDALGMKTFRQLGFSVVDS